MFCCISVDSNGLTNPFPASWKQRNRRPQWQRRKACREALLIDTISSPACIAFWHVKCVRASDALHMRMKCLRTFQFGYEICFPIGAMASPSCFHSKLRCFLESDKLGKVRINGNKWLNCFILSPQPSNSPCPVHVLQHASLRSCTRFHDSASTGLQDHLKCMHKMTQKCTATSAKAGL